MAIPLTFQPPKTTPVSKSHPTMTPDTNLLRRALCPLPCNIEDCNRSHPQRERDVEAAREVPQQNRNPSGNTYALCGNSCNYCNCVGGLVIIVVIFVIFVVYNSPSDNEGNGYSQRNATDGNGTFVNAIKYSMSYLKGLLF